MADTQTRSSPPVPRWPMVVIILGLLAWGGWIVTGVVLGEYGRQDTSPSDRIALYKGLLVAVSVVLFVLFWSVALVFRSRRLRHQQAASAGNRSPQPLRPKPPIQGLDLHDESDDLAD